MQQTTETANVDRRESEARDGEASSTPTEAQVRARQERLLDEGIEETFPASDPVAVVRLT